MAEIALDTGGWISTSEQPSPEPVAPDTSLAAAEAYYLEHERTPYRFVAVICPVLFLARIPIEHAIEPTWWKVFLPFRLGAAVLGVAVYIGLGRAKTLAQLRTLCLVLVTYIGAVNALVILPRVEHFDASYMGLLLLVCGCAAMIPWTIGYSAVCYGSIWLAYLVGLSISSHGVDRIETARLHSFFLLGIAGAIAILGIHLRRRLIVQGFRTSYELKERNEQLRDAVENVRRSETRLALSEKLGALGRVTAGVAHEINNPLTYVIANTNYVMEELQKLAGQFESENRARLLDAVAAMREIDEGSHRVKKIVKDLQAFSRDEHDTFGSVDLRTVLDASLDMTHNQVRHRARLVKHYDEVAPVRGIEGRLQQLFVNLIMNAVQAIPEGRAEQNEIRIGLRSRPGDGAMITVEDTGCGIDPENMSRIFDPFFTTKGVGGGTGLGLSVCSGIVRNHGGRIHVESEPGHGTVVRVELPQFAAADATKPVAAVKPAQRTRILVIDDEPTVGSSLQRLLRPHQVEYCITAREALDKIKSDTAYDAVLCDLMMPDITGMEFYARLRETAPEMVPHVAFMTGGAFTESARDFLEQSGIIHMEKPVDKAEMLRVIEQLRGPV